nr:hypothetical protein ISGA_2059 [Gordonia sp. NB41Y]
MAPAGLWTESSTTDVPIPEVTVTVALDPPQSLSTESFFIAVVDRACDLKRDQDAFTDTGEQPVVLSCADLPTAQRASQRLREKTSDGLTVVPIVEVVATGRAASHHVSVPHNSRSVSSLAIDLGLLAIARGVIVVVPEAADVDGFRERVVEEMTAQGYSTRTTIPGWTTVPRG